MQDTFECNVCQDGFGFNDVIQGELEDGTTVFICRDCEREMEWTWVPEDEPVAVAP